MAFQGFGRHLVKLPKLTVRGRGDTELMRDYVRQMRSSRVPAISPDERLRREEAVRYARASVGLKGFR